MDRPRLFPATRVLSVTALPLTIFAWLALALLLQRNVLWEFTSAMWGAERDGALYLWALAWELHALASAPSALFDANIFYPARNTLALTDHMVANQLLFAPAYLLTGSPIVGMNILITGQFVLTALATFLLAYRLFGSWKGAVLAGTIFAFSPTRLAHMNHPQLLVSFWTPLALLFLDRFLERPRWRDLLGCSVSFALQFLASYYLGYFLLVATLIWLVGHAIGRPSDVLRLGVLGRGLFGAALAAALVVPFSLPYWAVQAEYGTLQEPMTFLEEQSAVGLVSYLSSHPGNLLYGRILSSSQPGFEWEKWLFPGFVCFALALAGLVVSLLRREGKRGRVWLAWTLVATAFLLSLGPEIRLGQQRFSSPYLLLWHAIPGFASVRVPARFGMLAAFGLSVAAAAGYQWLEERRIGTRRVVFGLALAIAAAEGVTVGVAASLPKPAQVPEEYRWLARNGSGAVLELPMWQSGNWLDSTAQETRYMYFSVYHWRPLVNGHSGYIPRTVYEVFERVEALPSTESVRYLEAIGVRHILVHPQAPLYPNLSAGTRAFPESKVARFPSGSLLVTLSDVVRAGDVSVRLLTPKRLSPDGKVELGVLFANTGTAYWVNPAQRACRVAMRWKKPTGQVTGAQRAWVLPPVALAPGEIRERRMPIRVPDASGPVRLAWSIACDRTPAGRQEWAGKTELTLERDLQTGEVETNGLLARYRGVYLPTSTCAGCRLVLRFHAENTGSLVWKRRGLVRLGYQWTAGTGQRGLDSGLEGRVLLERDVYPGHEVVIEGTIPTPPSPGEHTLTLDLVQELRTWFRERGVPPLRVTVTLD